MRRAIRLSLEAVRADLGGPFGAVIVSGDRIVAEGTNRVTSGKDPTAHAEIVAIREACRVLDTYSLEQCEIYSSCEPCPMCLAAVYWARIPRLYYGNTRQDAAAIGFDDARLYREVGAPANERAGLQVARVLPDEAKAAFDAWLQKPDRVTY